MPAFSRLQLAQALLGNPMLLEYDNDSLPPGAPRRSAHESAIFAHLRRTGGPARPTATVYATTEPRRSADYLNVKLPHGENAEPEGTELGTGLRGSVGARRSIDIRSVHNTRKSVDVLTSDWVDKRASKADPSELGYLDTPDEDEDAPEGGLDLSSWGLDKYVVKPGQEKEGAKSRQSAVDRRASVLSRAPSDFLPNPFARTPSPSVGLHTPGDTVSGPPKRPTHAHRHSDFGVGHAFLDAQRSQDDLLLARGPSLKDRRRSVANPLDLAEYRANGPHVPLEKRRQSVGILPSESIPFPAAESPAALADNNDGDLPNPFAVPTPPQERLSRFDPKAQQSQSQLGLPNSQGDATSVRTETVREGTARMRTHSNASMGSRVLLDDFKDDGASYMTGRPMEIPPENKMLTRMELLRPKVLVMPSPLQGPEPQSRTTGRAGFMLSSDGTPLPPGAQSGARPLTGAGPSRSVHAPSVMGSGFTPNPRATLSLSQLTFRNNLMVDGARDVAYSDIDGQLRRAAAEGEQAEQDWDDYDAETEAPQPERPAGRLYGRSLMDDLQDRKAQIHGRQRVFRGDNRPAMMERGQIRRQSTLIDSAAFQSRPVTTLLPHGPVTSGAERPNANRASTIQPLLNFDSNAQGRVANSKSVFGVDTVWEREMAKLKEAQEMQKLEDEAQQAREDEKQKGKGKKGKGKAGPPASPAVPADAASSLNSPELNRMSSAPPTLPTIVPLRDQVPPPASPGESETSLPPANRRRSVATLDAGGWFAGSSDGEDESGEKRNSRPQIPPASRGRDEDSDDDVPLTQIKVHAPASDDDEDAPLSSLVRPKSVLPDLNSGLNLGLAASIGLAPEPTRSNEAKTADSDDEVPLAIRRQSIMPQSPSNKPPADDDDDDEKPLGLRLSQAPNAAQQRRQAEYQQMMLMQQQQQIMMQQQAMRASLAFGGSTLSFQPQFGGPGSVHSFSAPVFGAPDPKLSRVDRWRHGVSGVEGSDV
ncbi:hypothetical protein FRC10_005117 [Ceratobasidium sp. 414]|nr:hypothetical protein FRC10_005117 [Ceratobasidium sp. 414]